ncbi:UDP-N-acetylmuramoyl-tripeptide--D-alanyl-D-alanine ligase [Paenibacillus sp. y28]|uniref:UDP-N-acetylmuramoyl-tripeptide--D-alanyl-D- alanine ligase n=1 Tax=Paenibacillus sp. y28 TaxID=3129110 RepID=UPI0030172CBD
MIKRTLAQIAHMVDGELSAKETSPGALWIEGVSTDSRSIQAGNLFVPLAGDNFDGHAYVEGAIQSGAAAALWQRDHGPAPEGRPIVVVEDSLIALQQLAAAYRDELDVRVIGVTGSNGKTTTKDMLAAMLGTVFCVHKTQGNLNNHIGVPLTLLQLAEETQVAIIEMGMSGRGEIELLSRLAKPEASIITNIGESHLLQLGSRQEIARAKLEIAAGMPHGSLLVTQGDDPLLAEELGPVVAAGAFRHTRFGQGQDNDVYPIEITLDDQGTHFKANGSDIRWFVPLLGQHNVINALGAIAVCRSFGVEDQELARGLRQMQATGMRIELVKAPNGLTILNDAYNASPSSMRAALKLLAEMKGYESKVAVLGDMLELGDGEAQFHHDIGSQIDSLTADYVFTYGERARHIAEAAAARLPAGHVLSFSDKSLLVDQLLQVAQPQDIILVKGSRGMKLEEVIGGLLQAVK